MAKNYSGTGKSITLISPAGGTTSGVPLVVNDLVMIPLDTTVQGQTVTVMLGDAWRLPVTGALKAGVKVSVLTGTLVAAGTASSVPFGKLLTDAVGGFAEALLIQ